MDDGRPGRTIGISAAASEGNTDGPRGTTYCSTAGGRNLWRYSVHSLRTALGFEEGGTLSGGRPLDGIVPAAALGSELAAPEKPDPADLQLSARCHRQEC